MANYKMKAIGVGRVIEGDSVQELKDWADKNRRENGAGPVKWCKNQYGGESGLNLYGLQLVQIYAA